MTSAAPGPQAPLLPWSLVPALPKANLTKWDLAISFWFSFFFFPFCFFPPYHEAVLIGCLSSLMLQASLCRGGYSRFTPY